MIRNWGLYLLYLLIYLLIIDKAHHLSVRQFIAHSIECQQA